MTDDIYKTRERVSNVQAAQPKKRRRRRTSSQRRFDEHDRSKSRRRSKNSGLRRLKHVWKKPHVQKRFVWVITIFLIFLLCFVAFWQFHYQDQLAYKEQEKKAQERAATQPSQDQ